MASTLAEHARQDPSQAYRWVGQGASCGSGRGPARVLRDPVDIAACRPGEVVLMRHATPHVAGVSRGASALVCETGGVLNHLAILARELGVPCVTGLPGIVDAVNSGDELHVDGTSGFVDGPSPVRAAPAPTPRMVPLLRFGQFSPTFECNQAILTPEAIVRIATLVQLPEEMGLGAPLEIVFKGNLVMTPEARLRSLGVDLACQLEAGMSNATTLRAAYEEDSRWPGWGGIPLDARAALERFVRMNQITWVAALAKEDLAWSVRGLLARELNDAGQVDECFLRSLTTIGASYLLGHESFQPVVPRSFAAELRAGAMAQVRSRIQAMADLVAVTEHKNTELARCAAIMHHVPIAATVGLASLDDDGTDAGRYEVLQRVSEALGNMERRR